MFILLVSMLLVSITLNFVLLYFMADSSRDIVKYLEYAEKVAAPEEEVRQATLAVEIAEARVEAVEALREEVLGKLVVHKKEVRRLEDEIEDVQAELAEQYEKEMCDEIR